MLSIPFALLLLNTGVNHRAAEAVSSVPIRFEANQGQFADGVRFASRFGENQVLLGDSEATVLWKGRALTVRPAGSAARAPEGVERSRASAGNFTGSDPSQWKASIPQYAKVRYSGVYSGIDLVYRASGKQLEYDFVVAPGADPSLIRMDFQGADRIASGPAGELIVTVGDSCLKQPRPFVYQRSDSGELIQVAADYRISPGGEVEFVLGAYDRGRTLVIDPVITGGTYFGGDDDDVITASAIDAQGRLWVTGYTSSTNLKGNANSFRDLRVGGKDIFVAVFDTAKTGADSLIYSTYLGGSNDEEPRAIAVDSVSSCYITGYTASTDFPVRNGYQDNNGGARDAFVAQINLSSPGQGSLWYASYFGAAGVEVGNAVAVDARGRIHVAGYTASDEFPLLGGSMQRSRRGGWDAFYAAFEPPRGGTSTGVYSTYFGGGSTDVATGVVVDNATNRVYMSGYTMSGDFPVTDGAMQMSNRGKGDAFVVKFDFSKAGLDAIEYATLYGGTDLDQPNTMVIDGQGRLYLAGLTRSNDLPMAVNAYQTVIAGESDAFVARLDYSRPRGQELTYSSFLGGNDSDIASGLAVDRTGRILVSGYTFSKDFPYKGDGFQPEFRGGYKGFVAWFDPAAPAAESLPCSSYLGGAGNEVAAGIAATSAGVGFAAGSTNSRDLALPEGALQASLGGFLDGFVVRLNACPARP